MIIALIVLAAICGFCWGDWNGYGRLMNQIIERGEGKWVIDEDGDKAMEIIKDCERCKAEKASEKTPQYPEK